jgi:uncharacterized protein YecT (DUF1311 family)
MRLSRLAAALALSSLASVTPAAAQEVRPSHVACDPKKYGARDLAECLRTAADKADRELQATIDAALKAIDARPGLLSSQKARWRRSLTEAQALWISWRDEECQDVAPFEAGMTATGGDPRLSCIIDDDAARVASLKGRYS